jgi:hypothetical protein
LISSAFTVNPWLFSDRQTRVSNPSTSFRTFSRRQVKPAVGSPFLNLSRADGLITSTNNLGQLSKSQLN